MKSLLAAGILILLFGCLGPRVFTYKDSFSTDLHDCLTNNTQKSDYAGTLSQPGTESLSYLIHGNDCSILFYNQNDPTIGGICSDSTFNNKTGELSITCIENNTKFTMIDEPQ